MGNSFPRVCECCLINEGEGGQATWPRDLLVSSISPEGGTISDVGSTIYRDLRIEKFSWVPESIWTLWITTMPTNLAVAPSRCVRPVVVSKHHRLDESRVGDSPARVDPSPSKVHPSQVERSGCAQRFLTCVA